MMVVILTAPRKHFEWYFAETYAEVRRQLDDDRRLSIVIDGDEIVATGADSLYRFKKHRGGNRDAFFVALNLAAACGEDLVFFEDDLTFCKNAVPYMLGYTVPDNVGWVQFFTPGPIQAGEGAGLHVAPPGTSGFNQALKFSWRQLCRIAEWEAKTSYASGSADQTLRMASKELNIPWASHQPDLVQHIGAVSAHEDGRKLEWWRQAHWYPGNDFDAFSLRDKQWR